MYYIYQPYDDLTFCIGELGQKVKKWHLWGGENFFKIAKSDL